MSAANAAFLRYHQIMHVERFYLGCLAHASYLVVSDGIAAVIDPQRDVDIYLDAAAANGWTIQHIIETHLHADFVSGHRELAERTSARIYLGEGSGAQFDHVAVKDGAEVRFGTCRFRFVQTPGHTLESICILLDDLTNPAKPSVLFTGDTLFVGDVGRPDLSPTHTPQQLAALLYDSLRCKILTLPDETVIYPAHGAGSLCGRQMSAESFSTIGEQRRTNYALQASTSEEFVRALTDSLPAAPEYFSHDADLNRRGAAPISKLAPLTALSAEEVSDFQDAGAVIVDTRPATLFASAHVPSAVHIALTGQFASWAARMLGLHSRIVIVGEDDEHVRESQLRLARVGIENIAGYLNEGVIGWVRSGFDLETLPQITAHDLARLVAEDPAAVTVVDVRESSERASGYIPYSSGIPLGALQARMNELDRDRLVVVHCKGGYRSSIAASLLQRAGFMNVANLIGGYDAWTVSGVASLSAHP